MSNETTLHIAHVLLSRGFAGSERSTAESCNQQSKAHKVTLFIRKDHRKNGLSVVDHINKDIRIIELPSRLFTQYQLNKHIKHLQPDIIHCHLRRSTRLAAKIKPKAATVSTLHISFNGPHFWHMDGIICNARWQIEDIPDTYKGCVFKANNSLTPHPKLSDNDKIALRRELGFQESDYLIGGVGRLHDSKAWDTLINAFKAIKEPKNAKLAIVGDGNLKKELTALAGDNPNIVFIGYRQDVKNIYQIFNLLICPSRFEPLPRVMLEAMDAQVPIIASNIGGCKELIDDYGGETFCVDDSADLAIKLEASIQAPPPPSNIDLSAHHLSNTNTAMIDFYRQAIHHKNSN